MASVQNNPPPIRHRLPNAATPPLSGGDSAAAAVYIERPWIDPGSNALGSIPPQGTARHR